MTCNGCVGKLQKSLNAHEEISSAVVQLEPGSAQISGQIDMVTLKGLIEKAGFKAGNVNS